MSVTTTPSIQYEAAQRTQAVAAGQPLRRFPLPQCCPIQFAAYAFDQDFEMLAANFPPAQKNTPSNGGAFAGLLDGNAILTKLSQPASTAGGKVKFRGSFCVVPASWDDFTTMTVTFPGWVNYSNVSYLLSGNTRPQKVAEVNIRIRHDYFLVGSATSALDSGGGAISVVSSKGAIPSIYRQKFFNLYSSTTIPNTDCKDLVPTAGLFDSDNNYHCPTVPSVSSYQAWCVVAAGLTGAWSATNPTPWDAATDSGSYGQYCFRDSVLSEHEGNIIDRMSYWVLAQ